MNIYYDRCRNEIKEGLDIRCSLNGEVEIVRANGVDLGIYGNLFGTDLTFISLMAFATDDLVLENFEII